MSESNGQTCLICEQGDLGLFGEPLSVADQQKINEENKKEQNNDADEK